MLIKKNLLNEYFTCIMLQLPLLKDILYFTWLYLLCSSMFCVMFSYLTTKDLTNKKPFRSHSINSVFSCKTDEVFFYIFFYIGYPEYNAPLGMKVCSNKFAANSEGRNISGGRGGGGAAAESETGWTKSCRLFLYVLNHKSVRNHSSQIVRSDFKSSNLQICRIPTSSIKTMKHEAEEPNADNSS